jgi:hypothetical protein
VQEHVLATVIGGYEAEATHLVEPLDGAANALRRAAIVTATEVAARLTVTEATATTTEAVTTAAEATTTTAAEAIATTEVAARRTVTKATGGAEATTTEVTARRTVAKATARRATEVAARRTVAKATAGRATEVTARRTVAEAPAGRATEIAAGRTVVEAVTAELTTRGTISTPRAELTLMNLRDETAALTVRTNLADQLIASLRGFNSRLSECRSVEEHVLAIRPKHKAETFPAVVPLHLGLNRPGATLRIVVRKHCVSYP